MINETKVIEREAHWFEFKPIQFTVTGRRPENIPEWFTFIWNADLFWGEVPFMKSMILGNIIFCIFLTIL